MLPLLCRLSVNGVAAGKPIEAYRIRPCCARLRPAHVRSPSRVLRERTGTRLEGARGVERYSPHVKCGMQLQRKAPARKTGKIIHTNLPDRGDPARRPAPRSSEAASARSD